MKRVYVAGPYSSDNVIGVLDNMRFGMRVATEVLMLGFAPFCPWHDYHFQLCLRGDEKLGVKHYYEYSMAWLRVSDMVLVLPGWRTSKGTRAEIRVARKMRIPVLFIDKNKQWMELCKESPHYKKGMK